MLTRAAARAVSACTCLAAVAAPCLTAPAAMAAGPQSLKALVRADERPVLTALRANRAWQVSKGRGITVAVLDSGVDPHAPDLAGSVTVGPDYTRGADPAGYRPPHLHGTYIASLIAGHGSGPGRAGGVIGIAPAARILSVRVLLDDSEPGYGVYNTNSRYHDAISRGIRYAASHGASVINMSLGGAAENRDTRAALAYAASRGVVVVAAAGNGGKPGHRYTPYSYPASYPGVIAVAALTARGTRAPFSDRNSSVVISAPGVGIVGAVAGGAYVRADGTSPASAFVAGVAALIRSHYPRLPPPLIEQALVASTRHRPRSGYSTDTGFGEVDAAAALAAAGRLAAAKPGAGLAPSARAVTGPVAAIEVVHRDATRIAAYWTASALGTLGFVVCLLILALLARRHRREGRDRRERAAPASALPTADPPGGPPP